MAQACTLTLLALSTASLVVAKPAMGRSVHHVDLTHLRVTGDVTQTLSLSEGDLEALPTVTMEVTFTAGNGVQHHTEAGPLLTSVIGLAGLRVDPDTKNDKLRHWVVATGKDGYQAVVSWGEIDPQYAGVPVIVSTSEDGRALAGPNAPARLVVPSDRLGGRYVFGLVRLDVQGAGSPAHRR
jgi:hypothetical protein